MDKRSETRGFSIGITSIAVIFTVLCLTIFAVLSVSTASQERKMAQRYAGAVADWWRADARCMELVELYGRLWDKDAPEDEYDDLCEAYDAEKVKNGDTIYIYFLEPINDVNSIAVTLEIGDKFEITGWREVYTAEWEPDLEIDVWGGV